MSEFRVKAGWPDGSVAEQSVVAADIGSARLEVERRGGHVFEVRRRGLSLGAAGGSGRGRIKMSEFLIFNQELIALLKAGLPVVRSFEILLERQKSPTLRRVLTDVRTRVNSGSSISEAFAAEGDLFPRLYWTSLKAGEKSGEIETVLRRYLKYQKTVIAMSRKVVSTLVYPAILIALSGVLIMILMTYVIPRFTEFFADFQAELPLLTVVVLAVANFLRDNILIILGAGAAIGYFGVAVGQDLRRPHLAGRRDPAPSDPGRHLPAVRDHAVHAQPRARCSAAERRSCRRSRTAPTRSETGRSRAVSSKSSRRFGRGRSSGSRSRRPASSPI